MNTDYTPTGDVVISVTQEFEPFRAPIVNSPTVTAVTWEQVGTHTRRTLLTIKEEDFPLIVRGWPRDNYIKLPHAPAWLVAAADAMKAEATK